MDSKENQLYVSYANQDIEIYDLVQQKLAGTLEISADWSGFSPDGKYIAAGNYLGTPDESTIRLIDRITGQELFTMTSPGMVMNLEFSPDGNLLIGGFQVGNHFHDLVWDIATQELVTDFLDYDYGLTFSPRNDLAATAKAGKIYIFSTDGWVLRHSYGFADPYANPKPKDFSAGGEILAVEDRYDIVFSETNTGEALFTLPDECDLRFSPKGTVLVTWCYQGQLKIWGVTP